MASAEGSLQARLARLKSKLREQEASSETGSAGVTRSRPGGDAISRMSSSNVSGIAAGSAAPSEARVVQHGDSPRSRAGPDPAELDALRSQADALRSMVTASQAQTQEASEARNAAQQEAQQLQAQLQASQQRMALLKEQLVSGQQAAEESEAHVVQEAVQRVEEHLNEQLRRAHHETEVQQRRVQQLESQLQQQTQHASAARAEAAALLAAQQRAESAENQANTAAEAQSAAQAEAERLRGALDAKAAELQSLEAAMGELAYEAESARNAELRCRRLQEELAQRDRDMQGAAADKLAAEQEARREAARASELHVRCLAAEERCSALFAEAAQLRAEAAEKGAHAAALADEGLALGDRRSVHDAVQELLSGRTDPAAAVAELMRTLRLEDAQQQHLQQLCSGLQRQQNGLLQRISRFPARLTRPRSGLHDTNGTVDTDAAPTKGIAKDWLHFLMEEAQADGKENGTAPHLGAENSMEGAPATIDASPNAEDSTPRVPLPASYRPDDAHPLPDGSVAN